MIEIPETRREEEWSCNALEKVVFLKTGNGVSSPPPDSTPLFYMKLSKSHNSIGLDVERLPSGQDTFRPIPGLVCSYPVEAHTVHTDP